MNISKTIYVTILGIGIAGWLRLGQLFYKRFNDRSEQFAKKIRSYNSGPYDQSVHREKLADDFLAIWGKGHIKKFAKNNGVSEKRYRSELKKHLGEPLIYWLDGVVPVSGLVLTSTGFTYLIPGGYVPIWLHACLVILSILFGYTILWVDVVGKVALYINNINI